MVKGLQGKLYKELRKSLCVLSLKERLRGGLMVACNILVRGRGGTGTDPFTFLICDMTQKQHEDELGVVEDIKDQFFTQRVVVHWNRLPREAVTASSLKEFNKCLDKAPRHMAGFS
ncbi:hypothetical protein HGM15179_019775 [Zosterops borbonicus]|uniref:Uncharacterized protein n=1 Tax=Zosterops borbonicus TaxID=364589 RepID=A0A8K1D916_9PASS|nr:hypothetical protein HGM15179_019775 [Zosterops borbonicus]